jgi:transcriptional regulator with GAF, ATPase, and Fis domain
VFSARGPLLVPIPLHGGALDIGRGAVGAVELEDGAMSRRHAHVELDGETWRVRDLGSRNGTAVDARRLSAEHASEDARVLRCGDTLFLLCHDLVPYLGASVATRDGVVIGPTLRRVWNEIDSIAASGATLHVTGETGSGKELAARRFHEQGLASRGRFVAVNCATIPGALAERLLFGARRGAYSGADADSDGHLQAANGGTLFLDEVAELEPAVQAKLLRTLETREVLPLGATRAIRVEVRICSATHGGLMARVADGRFRQDLFFRIGRPEVRVPPLRERAEEIPWLVQAALAGRPAHVSLHEKALAHGWPGNLRELALEVREAARRAAAEGSEQVEAKHLRPAETLAAPGPTPRAPAPPRPPHPSSPTREAIVAALAENGGNVAQTARALGTHRTQLRRWLERYGIEPRRGGGA